MGLKERDIPTLSWARVLGQGALIIVVDLIFIYSWAPAALRHHPILFAGFLLGVFCVTWAVLSSGGQHH